MTSCGRGDQHSEWHTVGAQVSSRPFDPFLPFSAPEDRSPTLNLVSVRCNDRGRLLWCTRSLPAPWVPNDPISFWDPAPGLRKLRGRLLHFVMVGNLLCILGLRGKDRHYFNVKLQNAGYQNFCLLRSHWRVTEIFLVAFILFFFWFFSSYF